MEHRPVTYFAVYLGHEYMKKINYSHCGHELFTAKSLNNKKQLLLLNKNYVSFNNKIDFKTLSNIFNNGINKIKKLKLLIF